MSSFPIPQLYVEIKFDVYVEIKTFWKAGAHSQSCLYMLVMPILRCQLDYT